MVDAVRRLYCKLHYIAAIIAALVLLPALQAHAQGAGLYIVKSGTGRATCEAITSPLPAVTWCFDGNTNPGTLKVWNGSSYVGGGVSGVNAINGLTGSLTIAGTTNQVNIVSGGSTVTLSLPQSIATTSSVGFGNVAVNALGRLDLFNGAGTLRASLRAPAGLGETYIITLPTSVSGVLNGDCWLAGTFAAGVLPVTIGPCPGGGGGGNIVSVGGQAGPVIAAGANDTNVTLTWAGNTVTPGWASTLSPTRGGLGGNFSAQTGLLFDTAGTITATLAPGGLTSVAIGLAAPSAGGLFEVKGASAAIPGGTSAGLVNIYQGSVGTPVVGIGSTMIVTRQDNNAGGVNANNALVVVHQSYGSSQSTGVYTSGFNYGTGDANGITGIAFVQAGLGTAYGGYFEGRANAVGANAVGLETTTQNNTGTDHSYSPASFPRTVGHDADYIGGSGNNTGGAAILVRSGGAGQWDVGLAFTPFNSGIGVKTTDIRSDTKAVTSIDIRGTHTTGITLSNATISGNTIQATGFSVSSVGNVFGATGRFGGSAALSGNVPLEVQGVGAGVIFYDRAGGASQRWLAYSDQVAGNQVFRLFSNAVAADVLRLDRFGALAVGNSLATLPAPPSGTFLQLAAAAGGATNTYATAEAFGAQGGFIGRRANGTPAARTALLTNQPIAAFTARGAYDATNYSSDQASVGMFAAANWAAGNTPTYITFGVTPIGLTTLTEAMRITGISGGAGYRVSLSPTIPAPSFNNSRPFSVLATTTGTRASSGGGFVTSNSISGLYVENTDTSQSVSTQLGDRTSVTAMVRAIENVGFTGTAYGTALVYEANGAASERAALFAGTFANAGASGVFYGVNGFLGVSTGATLSAASVTGLFEMNCQVAACATLAHGVFSQNLKSAYGTPVTAASAFSVLAVTDAASPTVEAWVDAFRLSAALGAGTSGIRYRVRNNGSVASNMPVGTTDAAINLAINGGTLFFVNANGAAGFSGLTVTGAATGKKVVCVDTATGQLYASSTGTDCSN